MDVPVNGMNPSAKMCLPIADRDVGSNRSGKNRVNAASEVDSKFVSLVFA